MVTVVKKSMTTQELHTSFNNLSHGGTSSVIQQSTGLPSSASALTASFLSRFCYHSHKELLEAYRIPAIKKTSEVLKKTYLQCTDQKTDPIYFDDNHSSQTMAEELTKRHVVKVESGKPQEADTKLILTGAELSAFSELLQGTDSGFLEKYSDELALHLFSHVFQKGFPASDTRNWQNHMLAFIRRGDKKRATQILEKFGHMGAKNTDFLEYVASLYYLTFPNARKAAEFCEKAIQAGSSNLLSWLGDLYCQLGEYEKAIERLQRAIQIKPNSAIYYCDLAKVYVQCKRYTKAKAAFEKACEIDPNYTSAKRGLEMVEAQRQLERQQEPEKLEMEEICTQLRKHEEKIMDLRRQIL